VKVVLALIIAGMVCGTALMIAVWYVSRCVP
jgi:hypothetical protein